MREDEGYPGFYPTVMDSAKRLEVLCKEIKGCKGLIIHSQRAFNDRQISWMTEHVGGEGIWTEARARPKNGRGRLQLGPNEVEGRGAFAGTPRYEVPLWGGAAPKSTHVDVWKNILKPIPMFVGWLPRKSGASQAYGKALSFAEFYRSSALRLSTSSINKCLVSMSINRNGHMIWLFNILLKIIQ